MNALQKTFLEAIKAVLWDSPFKYEENVTSKELFKEICRYEIAGVMSTKLDLFCKDDQETRMYWSKKAMQDYQKSLRVLYAQDNLCKLLASENIKPIFLKGMASAYYYPEPLLREIGDIDFLIVPENFETCCSLLEKNDYQKGLDGIRHIQYSKNNMEYECHRYFSLNMTKEDKKEDNILYNGCRNCLTRKVEGKEYYSLPDIEYGIVLLEHLKHHLIDGVGFRQIMDFVLYANKVLDDNTWKNKFQKMAKECNLERLAKTMTRTAQLYLGLKTDNITWCNDIKESLCNDFIELIFSCNNFGFVEERNKGTHQVGNIYRKGFFSQLNSSALSHMPIARKVIILRPIAWLVQLIRWFIKGIGSILFKKEKYKLSVKSWKEQKKLLKDLGV